MGVKIRCVASEIPPKPGGTNLPCGTAALFVLDFLEFFILLLSSDFLLFDLSVQCSQACHSTETVA